MENNLKHEMVNLNYEDVAALVTSGAAAGIAITKITGHSKTMGAIAGAGVSLLLYTVFKRIKR